MSGDRVEMLAALKAAGDWSSLEWRLDNLYWIVNKDGNQQKFKLNDQQRHFISNLWTRNLILKARQLGFSTLMQVLQLDQALFNTNHTGVTIADTLPNAGKLFAKVEFAYDHLPELVRKACPLATKNKGSGLSFAHVDKQGKPQPSSISIGVSARGGTVQLLHVSELGKISLKFPQRADEIKTGAFPAVPRDAVIVVESTAEGAFGLFWELCEPAIKRWESGSPETALDWRLHFFPWYECADYTLSDEDTAIVEVLPQQAEYFRKIEAELKIQLRPGQRAWYAKTLETLGKKMRQEYPSTPYEAFEAAIEGAIYGEQMTKLREWDRFGIVPIDPAFPVNTFWDLGVNDATSIWFHQQIGMQHRWSYYTEASGKGLKHWWDKCQSHRARYGYQWGRHFLPHDVDAEILGEHVTTKRRILESMGMGVGEGGTIRVVPRIANISTGIELTRKALSGNHWFDKRTPDESKGEDMGCGAGIKCLDGYQHEWDDKRGVWSNQPLHNWASHGADAWRQFAQGWDDSHAGADKALAAFKSRKRSWR